MAFYQLRAHGATSGQFYFYCDDGLEQFRCRWWIEAQDWDEKTTNIGWILEGALASAAAEGTYRDFQGMGYRIWNGSFTDDTNESYYAFNFASGDNFRLVAGEDWKPIHSGTHVMTGAQTEFNSLYGSISISFLINFKFWWGTGTDNQFSIAQTYHGLLPYPYVVDVKQTIYEWEDIVIKYRVPSVDYFYLEDGENFPPFYVDLGEYRFHLEVPTVKGDYEYTLPLTNEQRQAFVNAMGSTQKSISKNLVLGCSLEPEDAGITDVGFEAGGTGNSFATIHTENPIRITITLSDCPPIFNPVVEDTNAAAVALTGDSSKLIRYVSNAKVTANAEAQNGGYLTSVSITNGSNEVMADVVTFEKVADTLFILKATDSRYQGGYLEVKPETVEYLPLTSKVSAHKISAEGVVTLKVDGVYWAGNFGVIENSLKIYYRYKRTSETEYSEWVEFTDVSIDTEEFKYEAYAPVEGLDYLSIYDFQAYSVDAVGVVNATDITVSIRPIFDWGQKDFNFNVPVTIMGSPAVTKDEVVDVEEVQAALNEAKAELASVYQKVITGLSNIEEIPMTITPIMDMYEGDYSGSAILIGNTLHIKLDTGIMGSSYHSAETQSAIADITLDTNKIASSAPVEQWSLAKRAAAQPWLVRAGAINNGVIKLSARSIPVSSAQANIRLTIPVVLDFDAFVEEVTE